MSNPSSPQPSPQNHRRWGLSAALVVALIIATVVFVDAPSMLEVLRQTNPTLVLIALLFLLFGIAIIDIRWWYLLSRQSPFSSTLHATHVSYLVPMVTPIPNYISRVFLTSAATKIPLPQATTAMVVERMIAQIMRISTIVLAISLGVQSELSFASMARSLLLSLIVLALYLFAIRYDESIANRVHALTLHVGMREKSADRIGRAVRDALHSDVGMKELLVAIAITIAMWTFFFLFHFLVILAMPLTMDVHAKATIALGALALTPPSAPAMLGIYQISQIGPNLVLRLGALEDLLPYSLMLYFLQLLIWMTLTIWSLSKLDMRFRDLFRFRHPPANEEGFSNSAS